MRLSEQRTDNLEARIANLEDLIKQVANGKVPADKWLRTEIYEEPPKEEQERIQKELEEQIEAEEAAKNDEKSLQDHSWKPQST